MSEYRPLQERINDYEPVEVRPNFLSLAADLKRCQDCGIPFCHSLGCPLANVIPEVNTEALNGRWDMALAKLLETNPFPEFTGRICPALCEGSCVQGLNEVPVPIRLVELEVIERGFQLNLLPPRQPTRINLKVAVVGGGPAGLAAAYYLNHAGAEVVVYEKDQAVGGFLRYGIPDFKLEKSVIDRRIDLMQAEGVVFETGVNVGTDLSERLLAKRFDAVIYAIGSRKPRDLSIPGRDLQGIHFATSYLATQNQVIAKEIETLPKELNSLNKKVLVIGGGDTGSDCVGTSWRQKAKSVTQIEIMPKPPLTRAHQNPWPEWPRVLRTSSSHEEGGIRLWNIDSIEFWPNIEDPSRVGGLSAREVEWINRDGKFIPVPKKGSEFKIEADIVFLALGFVGPDFGKLSNFKADSAGRLDTFGFYVTGDALTGPSLVVRAINSGLKIAQTLLNDFAKNIALTA